MIKNLARLGTFVIVLIAVIAFTLNLKGSAKSKENVDLSNTYITVSIFDKAEGSDSVVYEFHSVGSEGIDKLLGKQKADPSGTTKIELDNSVEIAALMVTRIKSGKKKRQTVSAEGNQLTVDFSRNAFNQ